MMQYESGSFIGKYLFPINFAKFKILSIIETFFDIQHTYIIEFTVLNNKALCSQYLFTATSTQYTFFCSQSAQSYYIEKESYTMAAVAWYYCAGNSVYYWTKAYDMSATQFAIAVSERIGRTITASDVAQAIRQKEVDAMMRRASQAIYIPGWYLSAAWLSQGYVAICYITNSYHLTQSQLR